MQSVLNTTTKVVNWNPSKIDFFYFWCFNATFNNISAGDHKQATGKFYHLRLRVECTLFVINKAGREPTPYWL
jgi:hypothetical protein